MASRYRQGEVRTHGGLAGRSAVRIRQVELHELRIGMYVHDLNCRWRDHPFARNRFLITDAELLARVQALPVPAVIIDETKGWSIAEESGSDGAAAAEGIAAEAGVVGARPLAVERRIAMQIRRRAARLVGQMVQQVRFGLAPEPEPVRAVADEIVGSLLRNPNALLGLQQLRHKDRYTFEHSVSVAVLAAAFGLHLGLAHESLQRLATAGLLHDIGKARIPDTILLKCGRLTEDELALMHRHVEHTQSILESVPGLHEEVRRGAAEHHERHDGSGYPFGLKGESISLFGRIVGICDVYDALTVDRCYRPARAPGQALRWLLERAGSDFETTLVHRFIRCIGIYPNGSLVALRSGRLGVVVESDGHGQLLTPKVRVFYDTRRQQYLKPVDVDLAEDADDAIIGREDPKRWGAIAAHCL